MKTDLTPQQLRQRIRSGEHTGNTSGYCPGYVQCNMTILPKDWAAEFLQFCTLNPKPCPVLGMADPGSWEIPALAADLDVRTDIPRYRVFVDGELQQEVTDIRELWQNDFVTFMLGCSFSFEEALQADGLEIRNVSEGCNVPMYRSNIDCTPAGRFSGKMVMSMRPFVAADAIRAIQICTRFPAVHGAPLHIGDPARIGIEDLAQPDYGDAVTVRPDELPLFWACGVTPQVAIEQARPPICITHSPGCMLVTDVPNSKLSVL
ncbi:MAG: putative hydro-lyase [Thiolinea sp.]